MQAHTSDSRYVLILAHSWPPDGNVGAVRPVYLSRQLARLGLQPIVVTVKEKYHEVRNTGGISGADSAHVVRTRCITNPRFAYLRAKGILARMLRLRPSSSLAVTPTSLEAARQGASPGLRRNLLSLLHTPDEFAGWYPFALWASLNAIKRYRPTCVISTGPPHTAHLVALTLKRWRNIPWIADFRDPWAWHDLPSGSSMLWSDYLNALMEKAVVHKADRVVCVAPGITDGYADRYPSRSASTWHTITNGFDADEFRELPRQPQWTRFTISYVGTFDFDRSPRLLLQAVAGLIEDGVLTSDQIRVRIVGPSESAEGLPIESLVEGMELDEVVERIPMIPRPLALQELIRADALLLLVGSQRMSIAAKLYEYLAAERPIILVANECAAADIVRHTGAGYVIAPEDLTSMKCLIHKLYMARLTGDPNKQQRTTTEHDATLSYCWDNLGKRYSSLIDECTTLPA